MAVRILIIENRKRFRQHLRDILTADAEIQIAGEAGSGRDAIHLAASLRPDVILMDLRLETDADGIEVIREIRVTDPDARILVVSSHDEEIYFRGSLDAGIQGYLIKDDMMNADLIQAIHAVAEGGVSFHPEVQKFTSEILGKYRKLGRQFELTGKEKRVLALIAHEGLSNRAIGKRLNISEVTVKDHVSNIFSKLGVRNRTQAGLVARNRGLV